MNFIDQHHCFVIFCNTKSITGTTRKQSESQVFMSTSTNTLLYFAFWNLTRKTYFLVNLENQDQFATDHLTHKRSLDINLKCSDGTQMLSSISSLQDYIFEVFALTNRIEQQQQQQFLGSPFTSFGIVFHAREENYYLWRSIASCTTSLSPFLYCTRMTTLYKSGHVRVSHPLSFFTPSLLSLSFSPSLYLSFSPLLPPPEITFNVCVWYGTEGKEQSGL